MVVDLDPARALLERLLDNELPDDADFVAGWGGADVDAMIEILMLGARRGVYEVDGTTTWGERDAPPVRWLFRLKGPDGYVRIDVSRVDGADGARKCLPALAPRAVWAKGLDKAHDAIACPIAQLLFAIDTRGGPAPQWTAAHPTLQHAWDAATDSAAMRSLLGRSGRDDVLPAVQTAIYRVSVPPRGDGKLITPASQLATATYMRALADAVRTVVPRAPRLDEVR